MRALVALAEARAHERAAHAGHDRAHVGEVDVDEAGHHDQIADAAHGGQAHAVHHVEGFAQGQVLAGEPDQAVVGDHDERVDGLGQLGDAAGGLLLALQALEHEGLGHHADGQRTHLTGRARDDRRGAGAGAAAHARGDEHHVRAGQHLADALGILESGGAADIGIGAGAKSLGQGLADLDLGRRLVGLQHLAVGVGGHEIHALDTGFDHGVDGVAAAATHADHLDLRARNRIVEFEHVNSP